MELKKQGIFFTIDALLAAAVLLGGIIILSSFYINEHPSAHLNYLSQDIINALSELRINELNNSYVTELADNGTIKYTNNSILEQLGEFWAAEDFGTAEYFMNNVTPGLIPSKYGFSIWIDDDLLYQRDYPPPSTGASARRIISGIAKRRPTKGYVSNAHANSFMKQSTMIISFSPQGSGWYGSTSNPGIGFVKKYFEIPEELNITNASISLSMHIDKSKSWNAVNINNGLCNFSSDDLTASGEGVFSIKNIKNCLKQGMNIATLDLRNGGYNAHLHPGTFIRVDYTVNEGLVLYSNDMSRRYYFDDVHSIPGNVKKSGAWALMSFFIPPGATNISVMLQIKAFNVSNGTAKPCPGGNFAGWDGKSKQTCDFNYLLFVNGNSPFDSRAGMLRDQLFTYNNTRLSGSLISGTNVISVYLNSYGDTSWGGENGPRIYSNPAYDEHNSSYAEVNFTIPGGAVPYGNIKLTRAKEFGGAASYQKESSFSFPEHASSMGDVFLHVVEQYSNIIDTWSGINTPAQNLVFSSPSSRAVPTTVYIPRTYLELSPTANNYIRLMDRNINNIIMPNTTIEYSFYLPSFVGYNGVFSTQEEAEEDALTRLNQTLGEFVSSDDITIQSSEMNDVPSMWGPSVMEVRVWH